MKKLVHTLALLTLTLSTFGLNASSVEAQQCTSASDASTIAAALPDGTGGWSGGWGFCEGASADALRVSFFKLALCTSKPTISDDSACAYLLNTPNAISSDIEVGTESALFSNNISIPEGVYTHALMLIDTTIGVKFTYEFDSGNEQFDGFGDEGRYCWTNGNEIVWGYQNSSNMPMDCGSEPEAVFSSETFKAFGCDDPCKVSNSVLNEETATTYFDAYLLSDVNTLATVAKEENGPPTGNASYIWGVQTFKVPPSITPDTQKVELGFKLSQGLQVTFNGYSCSGQPGGGPHYCVEGPNVTGFEFTMSAE